MNNLFANLPFTAQPGEIIESLLQTGQFTLNELSLQGSRHRKTNGMIKMKTSGASY